MLEPQGSVLRLGWRGHLNAKNNGSTLDLGVELDTAQHIPTLICVLVMEPLGQYVGLHLMPAFKIETDGLNPRVHLS
jgi:hypothetical protein